MKKLGMLLLAALLHFVSFSQEIKELEVVLNPSLIDNGEMPYSDKPITWNEFRGAPDNSCGYIAMTYSGIKIKYSYKTRRGVASARVEFCPYMDLSRSWFKKAHCGDSTLEHEQRHFDITAIVTRQFTDALKKHNFVLATFPEELKKLHQEYLQKLALMQQQYDGETSHGTISEKQASWDKKIADEVKQALTEG